ncbi:DUF4124 domain-containing protein [Pseudothauera nasutitermitis]|uniref:DUF4124 domain-containing protein n=1 Tax=Pseudothauera nasutitermitis TaxID=2565930 RepID=A0A4S4AV02_9RHOO|nr:DUF4124 domain-containing protein [Pseudothauera nasutitermitis]THF63821.1 DUF4124 domain-containing protein [Pseudothauera nasutitermitis]
MPFRLLPLLFAVLAGSAHAQVYKCVDATGRVTYTNDRGASSGCTVLSQDLPISSVPAPAASEPAANDFPRVSPGSQRERDDRRRAILEEELAQEQRALEESQSALAEQEAVRHGNERNYQRVLDRLQPYKDKVELHQRNVDAIQRELRGLR